MLFNSAAFTSLISAASYTRQFSNPAASTAILPAQYPQRGHNTGSQFLGQRQSQRGRSRHRRQSSRRSRQQDSRALREHASSSREGDEAEELNDRMEVEEGRAGSPVPPSLVNLVVHGPSIEESDLPGYAYDSITRRYYRVQCDASGSAIGFRRSDFARARRERERLAAFQMNRARYASSSFALKALVKPISSLLCGRELGFHSTSGQTAIQRHLGESCLLFAKSTPNYTREVLPNHVDRLAGCQFLDVSKDGKTILGCWAVSNWGNPGDSRRTSSRIMCLSVKTNPDIIRHNGLARDGRKFCDTSEIGNNYGLQFEATPNLIYVLDPNLVDMTTAPVDSDVTCVLYVTASSHLSVQRKLTTCCRVFIEPIPELSNEEGADEMNSPIYNIRWTCQDEVWSCAWNANKMRIGLGMEENTMIVDVVSEQNFRISSRKKNVLSQQFSQDGEVLYMGLRGADMVCSDLRLKSRHIVATFEHSNSVGWIRMLRSQPNLLLSENFAGELKLWDIRSRKTLMSFSGHKNSHYRLPCFVDNNERFVFAVGEDGTARGWSLRTGDLLCAVPSPRPIEQRTDFPRIVYSENWGGRAGNSAIILAVEGDIRVHELPV